MKKTTRAILSVLLCAVLLLSLFSFGGCSATGEKMLTLDGVSVTENMYVFWLSRYKAQFLYAYGNSLQEAFGVASQDDFWALPVSDTETYDDMFTDYIYQNALTYVCALNLFDEFGLSLTKEETEEIDTTIRTMIDELAEGSKNEFNVILAEYNLNLDTLRACYEINAKITRLQNYLFSDGGPEALTSAKLEEYYRDTYVRMEQICIFFDQRPVTDESGAYVFDTQGNVQYAALSAAETTLAREKADDALAKLRAGVDFSEVYAEYNENPESDNYKSGIYLSSDSVYSSGTDAAKLYEALKEMQEGEVRLLELEHTLHVIRKLPLETGAYADAANADFFSFYDSSVQNYVNFAEYVKTPMFLSYMDKKQAEFADRIKVNEEIKNKHKISTVKANSQF